MKLYIYFRKTGIEIIQETTTQSILSDLFTMLVFVVLIGADVLFSIYVTHSFLIDCVIMVLFICYMYDFKSKKLIRIKDKKELMEFINKSIQE
jgi:hypothetical protein